MGRIFWIYLEIYEQRGNCNFVPKVEPSVTIHKHVARVKLKQEVSQYPSKKKAQKSTDSLMGSELAECNLCTWREQCGHARGINDSNLEQRG